MDNPKEWWNDFWVRQCSCAVSGENNFQTYSDLVRETVCEYWFDKFEKLAPGKNMLECGCGSANVSRSMAQRGYQCTLLDYSEAAIKEAKASFGRLSINPSFITGDINRLCFDENKFDIVFSGGVLEFFEDARKPINEMVRVLKPGGLFAANMVPDKFSIQTIADIERTIVCSIANLIKGKFKNVFKVVRNIPVDYHVNSLSLNGYIDICKDAGLKSVVGLVTSPFPEFALPRPAQKAYVGLMRKFLPCWRKFNESKNFFTKTLGITYTIYGVKA